MTHYSQHSFRVKFQLHWHQGWMEQRFHRQCSKSWNYQTLGFGGTSHSQLWSQSLVSIKSWLNQKKKNGLLSLPRRGFQIKATFYLFVCLFILCYLLFSIRNLSFKNHCSSHCSAATSWNKISTACFLHTLLPRALLQKLPFACSPQQPRSCLSACPQLISFPVPQAQRPASALPPQWLQPHRRRAWTNSRFIRLAPAPLPLLVLVSLIRVHTWPVKNQRKHRNRSALPLTGISKLCSKYRTCGGDQGILSAPKEISGKICQLWSMQHTGLLSAAKRKIKQTAPSRNTVKKPSSQMCHEKHSKERLSPDEGKDRSVENRVYASFFGNGSLWVYRTKNVMCQPLADENGELHYFQL